MPVIQYAEWLPDQADFNNPGATIAKNVIPASQSYRPFPNMQAQSAALTAYPRGAVAAQNTAGNTYVYAGDKTKLYEVRNAAASDRSGATYSCNETWELVEFGDFVIATNIEDAVQAITIGAATNFANAITSTEKPKARHAAVIGEFLFLGNINSTADGLVPHRVHWSAIRDHTDFDPAVATQCDYQDIREGGWVQKIVGGTEYGLIFMQHAIIRADYVGPPAIFSFKPLDRARGTPIPTSVCSIGRNVYFITEEGFFVTDGTQSKPIGHNKVDKWFWDQFSTGDRDRLSCGVDPVNKLVCWGFAGDGASGDQPNTILMYNWADDRWAYAILEHDVLFSAQTQGYTLEDIDTYFTTDVDDGSIPSLDSPFWLGGLLRLGGFNTALKLCTFDGANLEATIETQELQLNKENRTKVVITRPLIDGGTITGQVGGRDRLIDTAAWTAARSMTPHGHIHFINNRRYQRFRNIIAAGGTWTHAQGVEIEGPVPTGRK